MFSYFVAILEGEGWIGLDYKKKQKDNPCPRLQISMSDEDVIQNIADYLNVSYRTYQPKGKETYKMMYILNISGRKAFYVMEKVAPYLSKRRKERFDEIKEGYKPKTTYSTEWYTPRPKKPLNLPF